MHALMGDRKGLVLMVHTLQMPSEDSSRPLLDWSTPPLRALIVSGAIGSQLSLKLLELIEIVGTAGTVGLVGTD